MRFQTLAAVRFGYGFSPRAAAPVGPAEVLASLLGPDQMAERYPLIGPQDGARMLADFARLMRAERVGVAGAGSAGSGISDRPA